MENPIEEIKYQYEILSRWIRERRLSLFGINRSFYCQSEIEGNRKCIDQCDHCQEYYKPLENNINKNI